MPIKNVLYARNPLIDVITYLVGTILLCLLFSGIIYFSYQISYAGFNWDDAYYLLMADKFSPYQEEVSVSVALTTGQRNYPPIYPLYMALFGGGSAHIGAAQLATAAALVIAFIAFHFWLIRQSINPVAALLLTTVAVLSPITLLHFQTLWSEHLYLALSISALLCLRLSDRNDKYWLLAGALVALASLTRSVGITLIAAFAIHAFINKPPRRGLLILIAALPFIAERSLNALLNSSSHRYELLFTSRSLQDLWLSLSQSPFHYYSAWIKAFSFNPHLPTIVLACVVMALAAIELFLRLKEKRVDAFYVLFYLVTIVLWPYPEHAYRFIYPVFFILLGYAAFSLLRCSRPVGTNPRGIAHLMGILLFITVSIPAVLHTATRLSEPIPPHLADYRHTIIWIAGQDTVDAIDTAAARDRLIRDMRVIEEMTAEGSCVYTEFPPLVRLFAKRPALAPPWDRPAERYRFPLTCRYYYMIPPMLSGYGTSTGLPPDIPGRSTLMYLSNSPRDRTGREKLGVLLRL